MSTVGHPHADAAFFDCCRAGVAELLHARADFDVVEGTIDSYALDRDQKDALWLWASAAASRDRDLETKRI
jgi:hypothetical protein